MLTPRVQCIPLCLQTAQVLCLLVDQKLRGFYLGLIIGLDSSWVGRCLDCDRHSDLKQYQSSRRVEDVCSFAATSSTRTRHWSITCVTNVMVASHRISQIRDTIKFRNFNCQIVRMSNDDVAAASIEHCALRSEEARCVNTIVLVGTAPSRDS